MNTLGRDIKKGEPVILDSKYYNGTIQERTFTCDWGSGMRFETFGSAIFGTFPSGEKARVEGTEIDAIETKTNPTIKDARTKAVTAPDAGKCADFVAGSLRWPTEKGEER